MENEKHYYHCASKGIEDYLIFTSQKQFISAMNRVGICKSHFPQLVIVAFVLMNNHVHFILHGTKTDCEMFMALYKKLTASYIASEKGEKLIGFEYDCWLIPNREKLQEKICYVLRNPLAAGMRILPTSYCWGSGPLMFASSTSEATGTSLYGKLKEVGATTEYYRRKTYGTKQEIPSQWLVNDDGLIWPGSYVEYKYAEGIFGGAASFLFELNKKNEDLINREMYGDSMTLSDNDLFAIIKRTAKDSFGEEDISILNMEQRLDLIRKIRRTHGSDIKQLGRLLHIRYNDLKLIW